MYSNIAFGQLLCSQAQGSAAALAREETEEEQRKRLEKLIKALAKRPVVSTTWPYTPCIRKTYVLQLACSVLKRPSSRRRAV